MSKTEVINHMAELIGKFKLQSEAAKALGIDDNYKYSGHSLAEWKTDFSTRISELANNEEIKKNEKALNLIKDNLDHQDKKDIANSELEELLK